MCMSKLLLWPEFNVTCKKLAMHGAADDFAGSSMLIGPVLEYAALKMLLCLLGVCGAKDATS